jgi:hypothetical protein
MCGRTRIAGDASDARIFAPSLPEVPSIRCRGRARCFTVRDSGERTNRVFKGIGHKNIQHTVRYTEMEARPLHGPIAMADMQDKRHV